MSKKFLRLDGNKVMLIHYMPFDAVNGLHKSEAELLQEGVLVDEVPDPENRPGKTALPYYSAERGFYYEYVDAPNQQAMTLADSVRAGVITAEQYKQITGVDFAG